MNYKVKMSLVVGNSIGNAIWRCHRTVS